VACSGGGNGSDGNSGGATGLAGARGSGGSLGQGGSVPGGGAGGSGTSTGGAGAATGGGSGIASGGAVGSGGAPSEPSDAASEAAPPAPGSDAGSPGDAVSAPGLVKIFDGTSFDNWEYDDKAWVLQNGAMHGHITGGQSQAFTKKDYSNFRLIVWSRMTAGNDHLGICLWGGRPAPGKYGFEKCLLVIPPNAAIWDYLNNQDHPKPDYQKGMADWHRTEILANRTTGRVLVAVNGKLLHEYQDTPGNLAKRQNGPIGMQIHKAGAPEVEYKDIEIEVDPTSDRLVTLTPP
jgi:hypothetical protein